MCTRITRRVQLVASHPYPCSAKAAHITMELFEAKAESGGSASTVANYGHSTDHLEQQQPLTADETHGVTHSSCMHSWRPVQMLWQRHGRCSDLQCTN